MVRDNIALGDFDLGLVGVDLLEERLGIDDGDGLVQLEVIGFLEDEEFAEKGLQEFEVGLGFLVQVEVFGEFLFQVETDLQRLYVG